MLGCIGFNFVDKTDCNTTACHNCGAVAGTVLGARKDATHKTWECAGGRPKENIHNN